MSETQVFVIISLNAAIFFVGVLTGIAIAKRPKIK